SWRIEATARRVNSTTRSYACTRQAGAMRLGSYMTRTSRRGAFFGSRLATLMTSLIPRRWDVRRLHRIEWGAIKPGAKGRLEPFTWDTDRELYHQFGNIVGGVLSSLIVKKFRAWPITAVAPVELDEIDHSSSDHLSPPKAHRTTARLIRKTSA